MESLIPTSSKKKVEAGVLTYSAAGHVMAGDSFQVSARRELEEECGLKINEEVNVKLISSHWFSKKYPTKIEKEYFNVF